MPQMRPKKLNLPEIEVDTKNPTIVKQQQENRKRAQKKRKKGRIIRNVIIILVVLLIAAAVGTYLYFYTTERFNVEQVQVNGVKHLTDDEMNQLINVPEDVDLLKVDIDTIKKRLKSDAWIKDVDVVLQFPHTLVINVTERDITAIVEVPSSSNSGNKNVREWAISADHMWLMPVPDKNSEKAKNINPQIYADVEGVMHIVDVSPSVAPQIGSYSTDDTVNCAIDVVASMTTELKSQVKNVKATDASSANLFLNNGVEVSVGTSENMREKERVCLELLKKYEGKISYINVRNPSNPTWRTI